MRLDLRALIGKTTTLALPVVEQVQPLETQSIVATKSPISTYRPPKKTDESLDWRWIILVRNEKRYWKQNR